MLKDVVGYEGLYQISDSGTVFSLNYKRNNVCKQLKHSINTNGYAVVTLCKSGKTKSWRVHRLLAIAFLPNPESKPCINHINGIRDDNRISNLEWVTYQENNLHLCRILRSRSPYSKPISQFDINGGLIKSYTGAAEASRITGIAICGISKAALGVRKSSGGFIWKYS